MPGLLFGRPHVVGLLGYDCELKFKLQLHLCSPCGSRLLREVVDNTHDRILLPDRDVVGCKLAVAVSLAWPVEDDPHAATTAAAATTRACVTTGCRCLCILSLPHWFQTFLGQRISRQPKAAAHRLSRTLMARRSCIAV